MHKYLFIVELHDASICIGTSDKPSETIANLNNGHLNKWVRSLSINNIKTIREMEDGLYERAINHYTERNRTIISLNTNEIINDKADQRTGRKKRTTKT